MLVLVSAAALSDGSQGGTCSSADGATCNGFFTVLMEREPWVTRGEEPCADSFGKVDEEARILSAQMQSMGATLTVFTSYRLPRVGCSFFDYPNIEVVHVDVFALMQEYGFDAVVEKLSRVRLPEYTRVSDIVRIMLAHKYEKTYIDFDIHFISNQKAVFERTFVGAQVWSEIKCSLEITNAAFCLPRDVLTALLDYMRERILSGGDMYYYAELGPVMFMKVLMNRFAVPLYSMNNPEDDDPRSTARDIRKYNHSLLHLTSTIRLFLVEKRRGTFLNFVHSVRREAGLPALSLPPSRRTIDDSIEMHRAFISNHGWDEKGVKARVAFAQLLRTLHLYTRTSSSVVWAKEYDILKNFSGSMQSVLDEAAAVLMEVMETAPASSQDVIAARTELDELIIQAERLDDSFSAEIAAHWEGTSGGARSPDVEGAVPGEEDDAGLSSTEDQEPVQERTSQKSAKKRRKRSSSKKRDRDKSKR
jgi:hypothetical protein